MIRRFLIWADQMLLAIDQLAFLLIQIVTFVLLGRGRPNADETISSQVGRSALDGKRWALIAEAAINPIFFWQRDANGRLNHCRHAIEICEASKEFLNRHPELAPSACSPAEKEL